MSNLLPTQTVQAATSARAVTLSPVSRWLTRAVSAACLLLGLVMFALPGWSARHFPWHVSSFLAMTLGSYLLGNAWIAAVIQRVWTFSRVYSLLSYLWLFGLLETVVVIVHRAKLSTGAALTVPYFIVLAVTVAAAVVGVADCLRLRPSLRGGGRPMPALVRSLQVGFIVVVGFIAIVVLDGPKPALDARYFPQPLTTFTLGALGVFYLSLSLSVLFMITQRGTATLITYLDATVGLIIVIVIATLVFLGIFGFGAHPRHIVYLATYLVVLAGTVAILGWDRRSARVPG